MIDPGLFAGAFKRVISSAFAGAVCLAIFPTAFAVDDPWADTVIDCHGIDSQAGFTDPAKALGAPAGGGTLAPNNGKAYSIGRPGTTPGSYITLKFNTPILNDPNNPLGIDFVVHGNAFWVGGVPTRRWAEAALVEISRDVNGNGLADDPWYAVSGSRNLSASVLPGGMANPSPPLAGNVLNSNTNGTERDWGYADMSPTIQECRDNYLRPDDPLKVGLTAHAGGGDGFDISWAVKSDGAPANLTQVDFIRVSAFINGVVSGFGAVAPEISAAVDIDPLTDTDEDDVSDSFETRVSGTDPLRPESTVLPLEIPAEYGGSPSGTQLGRAADAGGNAIALFSKGARTGVRLYNCAVDMLPILSAVALPAIPGRLTSGAMRDFRSAVSDFALAQVQDAQFTLPYGSGEIEGLDEAVLEPWRFDSVQWTQSGLSGIQRDPATNKVMFRSAVPGIFALASVPGLGDLNVSAIPVVLHPSPATGIVANGVDTVVVQSDPILDGTAPVAEGTLLTVTVSPAELAVIVTADTDPVADGVQVPVSSGRISFTLRAATAAGRATLRASTPDGRIGGELPYFFLPGPPALPTDLWLQNPNATAPGPIYFFTGEIRDAYGNRVADGTLLTLELLGAVAVGAPDADPAMEGFQVRCFAGIANFSVRTDMGKSGDTRGVQVQLYAEATLETVLAEGTYLFAYVPVPGPSTFFTALMLLTAGIMALIRFQKRVQRL